MLTLDQQDVLKELFNRGIGRASQILSEMTRRTIVLSVPRIVEGRGVLVSHSGKERIYGVHQVFSGLYHGSIYLFYTHQSCMELIASILNLDETPEIFGELEKDVLCEFGNIIITSCLIELDILFNAKLLTTPPKIVSSQDKNFTKYTQNEQENISLSMDFSIEGSPVIGEIAFTIDSQNRTILADKLTEYFNSFA